MFAKTSILQKMSIKWIKNKIGKKNVPKKEQPTKIVILQNSPVLYIFCSYSSYYPPTNKDKNGSSFYLILAKGYKILLLIFCKVVWGTSYTASSIITSDTGTY